MNPVEEPRQVISNLSTSVSAFAVLTSSVEAGLLDRLTTPCSAADLSVATGLEAEVITRMLDVLVPLGLLQREGDDYLTMATHPSGSHDYDELPCKCQAGYPSGS